MSTSARTEYLPFGKPNFSDEEIAAVTRVMRSGWVGMGPETLAFEQDIATAVGSAHAVAVNSCTSALFLSLLVLGIKPGDEVICPSLTWCATANAAAYLGAKPVFCDVDADTLNVTSEHVLAKVTSRTKAVVVVHFGGLAVDVASVRQRLPPSVAIVEDAAHAFGARYADGQPVGSSGNLTCFSFYANKNISTGEGGAIALSNQVQAERLQSLRQNALPINAWKRFVDSKTLLVSAQLTELGYKMNYTDLQAAIGRVQIRRSAEFAAVRLAVARRYRERLNEIAPRVRLQSDCAHPHHARHLFTMRLPDCQRSARDEILLALRERNIGATIHYAPLHTMPLYTGGGAPTALPETERIADSIMTLPISASMSAGDADYVVSELHALLNRFG
jgi:perosamine synthetase